MPTGDPSRPDRRGRERKSDRPKREIYRFGGDTKRMPESSRKFTFRANSSRISERPLLQGRHTTSSDIGFSAKDVSQPKFQSLDNMTDSDEEVMDLSDGENEQRPLKKRIVEETEIATEPKWSNPEIYSALPPLSENRKRKDVVKLIRKARLEPSTTEQIQTPVQTNEDFISFDLLGHESLEMNQAPTNAPSGPRGMNKSPSSHKRKREHTPEYQRDREDTSPNFARGQKAPKRLGVSEINGSILPAWRLLRSPRSTPWVIRSVDSEGAMSNGLTSLHKEILDFYAWVRPQNAEQEVRADLIGRLQYCLWNYEPDSQLLAFGSFASGLYLPTGDMDLVLLERNSSEKISISRLWKYVRHIKESNIADPSSIQPIPHAKVPIIKFVDRLTGLRVDLSFNNTTGVVANDTYDEWKSAYPALNPLVTVLKQYLLMRGLSDVSVGGLGGFSLTCLVTSFIQHFPLEKKPPNLGRMLMEFFNLYGKHFNHHEHGIGLNPPSYFNKYTFPYFEGQRRKRERLAISDPNRPENDVSGGTHKISLIFDVFSEAYDILEEALDEHNLGISITGSLLGDIIAGDYSTYEHQRNHLQKVFEKDIITTTNHKASSAHANGRPTGSISAKTNINDISRVGAHKPRQLHSGSLHDKGQTKSLNSDNGPTPASNSPKASKPERRANRLRELRPDIPNIGKFVTVNEAVELGGYKDADELHTDLQIRENRMNAARK